MAARPKNKRKILTKRKAKIILEEGEVRGRPLTKRQRGFFGAVAGGNARKRKRTR